MAALPANSRLFNNVKFLLANEARFPLARSKTSPKLHFHPDFIISLRPE